MDLDAEAEQDALLNPRVVHVHDYVHDCVESGGCAQGRGTQMVDSKVGWGRCSRAEAASRAGLLSVCAFAVAVAGCGAPRDAVSAPASSTGASGAQAGGSTGAGATAAGATAGRASSAAGRGGRDAQGSAGVGGADPSGGMSGAAGVSGGAGPAAASGSGGAASVDAGPSDAAAGGDAGSDDRCDVGAYAGTAPQALRLTGNTFAHDPTMIEADGVFYRFWTGDDLPMASSTDLMNWTAGAAVYRDGYPDWSREWLAGVSGQTFNFPWAPDVSFFNGKYHLYSSFSAKFGDNISCITHLTTDDIASGDWTDHGPVICTEGDEPYNAIDADVGFDTQGKPFLAFGSFWDGIMAFELDANGDRVGTELTRLAWAREIEAPVLFRRCGYYYLFVTWGLCCPGQGRRVDQLTYRVAVGRSENVLGPYLDKEGVSMVEGGGTLIVQGDDAYAAAGHSDVLVTGDRIYHLYHAYRSPRGDAELRIVEMPFDDQGWPVPAAGP
jgi:arabinan endo-1,5-alpha-L-arabinosidase